MQEMRFNVCPFPFSSIEIHADGRVFTCCEQWLKPGMCLGNIKDDDSLAEIFNSRKAQNFRLELRRGNYKGACMDECPKLQEYREKGFFTGGSWKPLSDKLAREINEGGEVSGFDFECVSMAADPRCNLRCVMCRVHNIFELPKESIGAARAIEEIKPYLHLVREIKFSGEGEPFFIPEIRDFLFNFPQEKYPQLGFVILTNGLLLNRKVLERISHLDISAIIVSMDGATKETYESIRRNGKWELLMDNLEAISERLPRGEIGCFSITMTVMRENIDEMMEFYRLAKRLGCPYVTFQRMYGDLHENIFELPEPQSLLKLKKVLDSPAMNSDYVNDSGIADIRDYQAPISYRLKRILHFLPGFNIS